MSQKMKVCICLSLLSGAKLVAYYDFGAVIFTIFFIMIFMTAGTDGSIIMLYILSFFFVLVPRAVVAGALIKALPRNNIIADHAKAMKWAKIACVVRIISLIPSLIFDILETNQELKENDDYEGRERRSKGGIIAFNIIFMLASVFFTLYFSFILYMYHKKGPNPEYGPQNRPPGQQQNLGALQGDEGRFNFREQEAVNKQQKEIIVAKPTKIDKSDDDIAVGEYAVDENQLEGKHKQNLRMSLNGGHDDNDPKLDHNPNLDINSQDIEMNEQNEQDGQNEQQTPPSFEEMPQSNNRVVDDTSPKRIPKGHFL